MNNWGCPHLIADRCRRVDGRCDPASERCVLKGKVRRAGPSSGKEEAVRKKEEEKSFKPENKG